MFTIRTTTRVLFAAAVLAFFRTAQAAEKPKSLAQGPNAPPSFTYQKIESKWEMYKGIPHLGKPPTGSGSVRTAPFADGLSLQFGNRRGKRSGK